METMQVEPDGFFSPSLICTHGPNTTSGEGKPVDETAVNKLDDPSGKEQSSYHVLKRLSKKWMKPLCLNLEGLRKFSEDKYEEALGLFQQAAAADEINTNALRHCRVVYRKLGRLEEVEKMSRQIEAMSTGEHAQVSRARSIAEVAVAGIVQQSMNGSTSSQMLQHAIKIAENRREENSKKSEEECSINAMEVAFWKLALAKAIINASFVNANIQNDIASNNTEPIGNIYAELASGDFAGMTAYALAQIGLMLKREGREEYESMQKIIQEQQVLGGSLKQKDYFEAAHKLDPSSPSVCRNYALYLCYNKEFPEAQAMMRKTFECLESNEYFVGAHAASGEILLKLYEQGKFNKEYEKKKYLVQAITDLRFAARDGISAFTIGQLAKCYHLQLLHDSPISIDQDDMERILAYFEKAIELCGCNSNTHIHFFHSKCLAEFGYIRQAVESRKRVVENDDRHLAGTFYMYNLLLQFVKLYEEEGKKEEGCPDFILSEMTFWMLLMCNKYAYLEEAMRKTFNNLNYYSPSSAVRIYHNLRHLGHHNIADLFHNYIQGFSSFSRDRPIEYTAPPVLQFPHNCCPKDFDVLVLHSVTDRPWVYYALLTKLEMVHELKCCLVGRDILKDEHENEYEEGYVFRVDAGIQIPTVQGRNLVPIMKPIETDSVSIHNIHEKHVTHKSNKIEKALQSAIENSMCVMLVITENALNNSIWFRDYKPSALLQQLMLSHCKILALCLDVESCKVDLFPESNSVEVFDGSVLIPWEALVKHIKVLCGDTKEDVRKFDVEADLRKDVLINEDEDEDEDEDYQWRFCGKEAANNVSIEDDLLDVEADLRTDVSTDEEQD